MNLKYRNRFDRILIGWLIGIFIPIILFLIVYITKYWEMSLRVYIHNIWQLKILLKLLSLCVFPNLGFFFFFYQKKYDMAARGVIMATFMYAFLVMTAKLIQ